MNVFLELRELHGFLIWEGLHWLNEEIEGVEEKDWANGVHGHIGCETPGIRNVQVK